MPQIISSRRRPAATVGLLLLLASFTLAACGGSSSGSSSTAAAGASTSTAGGASGAGGSRFAALRECLQKDGITLPERTPGQRPHGAGGLLGGAGAGPLLPKGVTRAQFEAALKKCGGFSGGRFGGGATGRRLDSPAFKAALAKFATCMRANGVNVPSPNTTGKGPVFNTNGLNPNSAKFKAAQTRCASTLRGAFPTLPGSASGGTAGAGPSTAG